MRNKKFLSNVVISIIEFYQNRISPHKGFCCAYRIYHKGESCSQRAINIISTAGFFRSIPLIQAQFKSCAEAYRHLQLADDDDEKTEQCPLANKDSAACCASVLPCGWPTS
jgi:putative component of membrane protein insertase Oxa1/YidC/SpoIIIJ protein YidD